MPGETWLGLLGAVLIGTVVAWAVLGPGPLSVTNVAWLSRFDDVQHQVGWMFYRSSPWTWPPGANPAFGLEIGSSIFYSDSIPLLAIPLKAAASALPESFQYFGPWLWACLLLQAAFGWLLMGLASDQPALRVLGAGFFAVSPVMLRRVTDAVGGHHSLVAQWLVLAALLLCLAPPRRSRALPWIALGVVSAWVHPYLAAMVMGLWAADLAARVIGEKPRWIPVVKECAGVLGALSGALWLAGAFMLRGGLGSEGFGRYRMNVLALVSPDGWSRLLPDLPGTSEECAGFSYLGLGGLLLLAVAGGLALSAKRRWRLSRRYWPLAALCGLFTAFALSPYIGIGGSEVSLPFASWLDSAGAIFRVSGRMFWPVYYLLLWLALRTVSRRLPATVAVTGLALLLALQVWDTSVAWPLIRKKLALEGPRIETRLKSAFWRVAATHYRRVRLFPAENHSARWRVISLFAAERGLDTDATYLARIDPQRVEQLNEKTRADLAHGTWEPGTLYVLRGRAWSLVGRTRDSRRDLLADVDGMTVLAPGWKTCTECQAGTGWRELP